MNNRWIKLAIKEAEKSTFKFRVGCVIYNKNQFISSGHNYENRYNPIHDPRYRRWPSSVHAELDAALKSNPDELRGASILVVRINRENQFRMSAPCKYCLMYLKHVGIKKIYFTSDKFPYIERMKI